MLLQAWAYNSQNGKTLPPRPISVSCTDVNGRVIIIKFSDAITSDVSGVATAFTVKDVEYNYVPGGTLTQYTKTAGTVTKPETIDSVIDMEDGFLTNTMVNNSVLSLSYVSGGT